MFKLYLMQTAKGQMFTLGEVPSLEAAATFIKALGTRYTHWKLTKMGFEEPFHVWEGSDVCAVDLKSGESYFLEGTEGEDIWYRPEE